MSKEAVPPSFPEPVLSVRAWVDPVLDQLGHDPRSAYVETFWVPVLGPSSYLLLRRLAALLDADDDGGTFIAAEWAVELGLGIRGGKHGPFWRSIDRLARFGVLHRSGSALTVRRKLAPSTSARSGVSHPTFSNATTTGKPSTLRPLDGQQWRSTSRRIPTHHRR
ncbi:MAG: hypothetical protein R2706_16695 [Acidimicrobiales bacterium]